MGSVNRDDGSERRGRTWNRGTGRASSIESFFFFFLCSIFISKLSLGASFSPASRLEDKEGERRWRGFPTLRAF